MEYACRYGNVVGATRREEGGLALSQGTKASPAFSSSEDKASLIHCSSPMTRRCLNSGGSQTMSATLSLLRAATPVF